MPLAVYTDALPPSHHLLAGRSHASLAIWDRILASDMKLATWNTISSSPAIAFSSSLFTESPIPTRKVKQIGQLRYFPHYSQNLPQVKQIGHSRGVTEHLAFYAWIIVPQVESVGLRVLPIKKYFKWALLRRESGSKQHGDSPMANMTIPWRRASSEYMAVLSASRDDAPSVITIPEVRNAEYFWSSDVLLTQILCHWVFVFLGSIWLCCGIWASGSLSSTVAISPQREL